MTLEMQFKKWDLNEKGFWKHKDMSSIFVCNHELEGSH